MVKKCKVILNNDAVTVVRFDNIEVQFPSIHKEDEYVNVLYKDGKYKIVDSDYAESAPTIKNTDVRRKTKKTTEKEESNTLPDVEDSVG